MTKTEHLSDSVTLHLGDNRDVLPTLPRASADAVLTDPPYGVGKAEWDSKFPPADVWELIKARAKNGANVIVIPGEAELPAKAEILFACFNYQWVIPWYKPNAMQFGKTGYTKHNLIWWLSKGEPTQRPDMIDVIVAPMGAAEDKIAHPSPKPLRVMLALVANFSTPNQTILDPFMGSGTTGVAAVKLGRRFVGIEIDPQHFDLAARRISDALARPDLFIDRPARAEPPAELDLATGRP